ncbi:acyltransferase domain-containing protein [Streptomyces sp. YC504]|uniref:[acyl-carrier-protein] S-malonyltransferase n=1 Tax=Streptomyces mesophilus TaxID=1775132 RepID=A0A6G4XBA1_9ACTN|nr:acyltransferase domain-containing protein [Streptomyces mesophilus]NGO74117.1 acyltransferase domain-containing protein [Streptomyces mesophilus]
MSDSPTLIAFPGAASYQPGALASLAEKDGTVRGFLSVIDEVSQEFDGGPVTGPLLERGERDLPTLMREDPIAFHLAIYAGALAAYRALPERPEGHRRILLGLSLGEVMALVAGGAYDVVSGARIVAHRTRLLCDLLGEDTGAVVLEADAERAEHLLAALGNPSLAVAVENTATQTVVCGPATAVGELHDLAQQLGLRASRIATPFASHHPSYQHVSDRLWHDIKGLPQRPLREPVYSPISGGFYRDGEDLARAVADHISRPVRLRTALQLLHSTGVEEFIECAARPLLTPLIATVLTPGAPARTEPAERRSVPPQQRRETALPAPEIPVAAPAPPGETCTFDELRAVYVEALGYPPEAFEPETDLEADLGITSMRQTEILGKVLNRFELADLPDSFAVSAYPTMGEILEFVRAHAAPAPGAGK